MKFPRHNQRQIDKMRDANIQQKLYYEQTSAGWISDVNSVATNLWSRIRRRAMVAVSHEQRQRVYDIHKLWLGDLEGKKVLDLGAGSGSPLSGYLAKHARAYDAIELSAMQLETLKRNIGIGASRRFIEGDFLDQSTTDYDYDVIYAHAVLHHFRYPEPVLDILLGKLAERGRVITYDPLQTWLPILLVRAFFRPFQSDSDWEFPLLWKDLAMIRRKFHVVDTLGVFNRGKWALILGVVSPYWARRYGDQLFQKDFESKNRTKSITSSLHVSFCLKAPK